MAGGRGNRLKEGEEGEREKERKNRLSSRTRTSSVETWSCKFPSGGRRRRRQHTAHSRRRAPSCPSQGASEHPNPHAAPKQFQAECRATGQRTAYPSNPRRARGTFPSGGGQQYKIDPRPQVLSPKILLKPCRCWTRATITVVLSAPHKIGVTISIPVTGRETLRRPHSISAEVGRARKCFATTSKKF